MKKETFVFICFISFASILLLLNVDAAVAGGCWGFAGNQAACLNESDAYECLWKAEGVDWCPIGGGGCCELMGCWHFDGDKTGCEAQTSLGCMWEDNQYNQNSWCPISSSNPYMENGTLVFGNNTGCCSMPGCWDADGTNATYCQGNETGFMAGMCIWRTKAQDPYCPNDVGCCKDPLCDAVANEGNCTLLIQHGAPCEWNGTECLDKGFDGFDGAESCIQAGGFWNVSFCIMPDFGDKANVHCWFADFQQQVCQNITGCLYCDANNTAVATSLCYNAQIGWCNGHEYNTGSEGTPTDAVSCEDIKLESICDCGPVPGCHWNSSTYINGTFCAPGIPQCNLNFEDLEYDKCEEAPNQTICDMLKNTYFMPCKFNQTGDEKCGFDWESGGGFGDTKGDSDFEYGDIMDETTCEFAGGIWKTVVIDSYGNTDSWCEFGFGVGMEQCSDSCWACELQEDGQPWGGLGDAQFACENSTAAGGDCVFVSFGGSQDPSGRWGWCDFPESMDFFGGGNCEMSCFDCFGPAMCGNSSANCTWVEDPMGIGPGWCDPAAVAEFMDCSKNPLACVGQIACEAEGYDWNNTYVSDPFTGMGIWVCIANGSSPEICSVPGDEDNDGLPDCMDENCSKDPMCGFGVGDTGSGGGMIMPDDLASDICFAMDNTNRSVCEAKVINYTVANGEDNSSTGYFNGTYRNTTRMLPPHMVGQMLCFYHPSPDPSSDDYWCDPISEKDMMGGMMNKPTPIGNDPSGDADGLDHLDIIHVGIVDNPQNMDIGIPMKNITNFTICNSKLGGTKNGTIYRYIDSDNNVSTGCNATNGAFDGFDYKIVASATWNGTNSVTKTAAYKCVDSTNNIWTAKSATLTIMDDPCIDQAPPEAAMIGMENFSGVSVMSFSKSAFGIAMKDARILVATVGPGYSESNVTDQAGPFYYTPGAIDFKVEDCFGFVDMDQDGYTPEQDPDCKFINNLGFMPVENCFDGIDNNADGYADCNDPMCVFKPVCGGAFDFGPSGSDTTSPQVIFHKVDRFHDGAFVKFDTNEPANGTLYFYKNDSACMLVNKTLVDIGDPLCTESWCDFDDYKFWHGLPIDNNQYAPPQWKLGYNLSNGTTYYFKYKVCDPSGNCAQSNCFNFTTKTTVQSFQFGMSAPSGFKVKTPWAQDGQEYSQEVNSTQTKGINITIECAAAGYSMTLVGVDIKQAEDFDLSAITCDDSSKIIGMDPDTWADLMFALSVDFVKISWALTGGTTTIYHCDDDGATNCVDVTTYLDCTTSGSTLTCKIPITLGFSVYRLEEATTTTTTLGGGGSSPGGGGASPGGDTAQTGKLIKTYTSITPMSPKTITETDLDTTDTALTEIYVDVKDPVVGVQMTIQKMSEKPEDAGEPVRNVYRYISVEKEYLDDSNIEQAHMRFKVRISWIQDNNIDQSSIALYRYENNEWVRMTTQQESSDGTYLYFKATIPGFSYFAIMADEAEGLVTTTTTAPTTETTMPSETTTSTTRRPAAESEEPKGGTQTLLIFVLVLFVVGAALGFLMYRRGKLNF